MKLSKKKMLVLLILFIMISQVCLPIFQNASFAIADNTVQEWDISANNNGSVIAKLDNEGTLTISGTGNMKNWDGPSKVYAPWYGIRSSIITVNIAEGVTNIGCNAFYNCDKLTNVTIEKGLTTIGKRAFQSCISLTKITIPYDVTTIGGYAFSGCSSLTNITIPKEVMSIGSYAFSDCSALASIEIPEEVRSLGDGAFSGCSTLKSITLSKGLTKIGSVTFKGCTSLETIIIPKEVKEIGYRAFEDCNVLTNVIIPKGVVIIHNQAFVNSNSINIICQSNSQAETYAKEKNIPYTIDDEKPKIEFTTDELENNSKKANITIQVTDNLVGVDENSLKYVWSTKATDFKSNEITTSFENGETIQREMLTGKYYLWVIAYDLLGNYIIQNSTVCNLDNTLPTITVSESLEDISEMIITVAEVGSGLKEENSYQYYVSTSDTMLAEGCWTNYISGRPITIENGRTENYYLFIKTISDKAGNVSTANGTMITIDEITYHRFGPYSREKGNITFSTNGNETWEQSVSVQIFGLGENLNENYKYAWVEESANLNIGDSSLELDCIEFEANGIANSKGTENGKYNLVIIEKIENKIIAKTKTFYLTTDVVAPTVKVLYSATEMTNENVIVSIIASEELQELEGWELTEDKRQLIKEYESNTEEKIKVKDLVGNETEQEIKITNLDKAGPVLIVTYSTTEMTNQNVIVTITANEEIQPVEGWKLTEDKKKLIREYEANVEDKVIVKDLVENKTEQPISITNIDRISATLDVKYSTTETTNGSVKVLIMAREELQELEGWELSGDKKQLIKEYTENTKATGDSIIVKDLAGNETNQLITVTNIDKIPVLKVVYSEAETTNGSTSVIIISDKQIQPLEGWELSEDKLQLTKTYDAGASYEVTSDKEIVIVKDLLGNTLSIEVPVINIKNYFEIKDYNITKENYVLGIEPKTKIEDFVEHINSSKGYIIKENEQEVTGGVLKTGQTIEVEDGTIYTIVVQGDVEGDGEVKISDMSLVNKKRLGKIELEGEYLLAADVTGDGVVDFKDLTKINKIRLNKITD